MAEPLTAVIAAGVAGGITGAVEWFRSAKKKIFDPDDIIRRLTRLEEDNNAARFNELEREFEILKSEHLLVKNMIAQKIDKLSESFDVVIAEQGRLAATLPQVSDAINELRKDMRELRANR